jgi:peptide/nickel transport system substrate-binding protein
MLNSVRTRRIPRLGLAGLAATTMIAGAALSAGTSAALTRGQRPAAGSSTLVVAIPGDVDNFDPSTEQLNLFDATFKPLIFSYLVKFGPTLNIEPDLATSWTENANATVFTFNIRTSAKFQNGDPVTATAVSDSLQHSENTPSVIAPDLQRVKTWDVVNPGTLQVTLKAPYAAFLSALADISIEAPGTYATARLHPVGSGPYEFVSWTPNEQIVLKAWPGYYGPKPATQNLIFKPIVDPQVALTDLYAGSVDAIETVPATDVSTVNTSEARVVEAATSNQLALFELHSVGPLANVKVKQALAYALDKPAIKAVAYSGYGQSIWNPIPPSSWAYTNITGYPYNLAKAKALLAQAHESNLSLSLIVPAGYPEGTQAGEVWQQSLAQIGVNLSVDTEPIGVWLEQYIKENYQITWNVFDVKGDPDSFYSIIMVPHLKSDFHDPEMLTLESEALATSNEAARKAIYEKMDNMVVDDLPVMPIQTEPLYSVVRKGVTGWQLNPLGWPTLATTAG